MNPPTSGCPFHPRCPKAFDKCRNGRPGLMEMEPDGVKDRLLAVRIRITVPHRTSEQSVIWTPETADLGHDRAHTATSTNRRIRDMINRDEALALLKEHITEDQPGKPLPGIRSRPARPGRQSSAGTPICGASPACCMTWTTPQWKTKAATGWIPWTC